MGATIFTEVINLAFVGHIGDSSLIAGVWLGNMYFNSTAVAVYVGLNYGAATFVSQSIGHGNLRLAGTYLNRGRLVILLSMLPMMAVLALAESFFLAIGIDSQTSANAQTYIYTLFPFYLFAS